MDKQNFYRRQKLLAANLNPLQVTVENTIDRVMADFISPGWTSAVNVVQKSPTPDMSVSIASAPHVGINSSGKRISIQTNPNIPITGITLPTAGNQKYITVLCNYVVAESGPVVTPLDGTINYNQSESYVFTLIQGTAASTGTAVPANDPADGRLIVCDILLSEGTTQIINGIISTARQSLAAISTKANGFNSASLIWNRGAQQDYPSAADAYYLQSDRGLLLPKAGFRILEGADPEADRPIVQVQVFTDHETYTWEEVASVDPMGVIDAENVALDTTGFNGALSATEDTAQKAFDVLDEIAEKKPTSFSYQVAPESGIIQIIRFLDTYRVLRDRPVFFMGLDQSETNRAPYYTTIKGENISLFKDQYIPGNALSGKSTANLFGFTATIPSGSSQVMTQITGSNNDAYVYSKELQTMIAGDSWGTQSTEANVATHSNGATSYADVVSESLTLTNSANKVLALAISGYSSTSSSSIDDFTLAIDGTAQDELQHDKGVLAQLNFGLAWLFSPGNTSAHTYALRAKCNSGTLALKSPGLVLIEIPAAAASSISSLLSGAGQKRNTMTVAANSRALIIFTGQINIVPNSTTSTVGCKFQVDDADVTQEFLFSGTGTATPSDTPIFKAFITDALAAGSHNFDAEIVENGTGTLVKGRLITVEIPA